MTDMNVLGIIHLLILSLWPTLLDFILRPSAFPSPVSSDSQGSDRVYLPLIACRCSRIGAIYLTRGQQRTMSLRGPLRKCCFCKLAISRALFASHMSPAMFGCDDATAQITGTLGKLRLWMGGFVSFRLKRKSKKGGGGSHAYATALPLASVT